MKRIVFFFLTLASGAFAQDHKEASSEKASIMEGLLRDTKPTVEKTLADGTLLSVWILNTNDAAKTPFIAKATAKRQTPTANEDKRSIKANFTYDNAKLLNVDYKEINVVQNPTPSVKTNNKFFVFTDGVQTSPKPGSLPEAEKFVSDCAAEITKLYDSHVNSK